MDVKGIACTDETTGTLIVIQIYSSPQLFKTFYYLSAHWLCCLVAQAAALNEKTLKTDSILSTEHQIADMKT